MKVRLTGASKPLPESLYDRAIPLDELLAAIEAIGGPVTIYYHVLGGGDCHLSL